MFNFKNLLAFLIALLFIANFTFAQNNNGIEKYSKVRIFATSDNDFAKMGNAGLFLDGGIYKKGLYFETLLSESEIMLLKNSGVPYQVTIDDWMQYYNNLPKMTEKQIQEAMQESKDEFNIYHSIYGTMGGHLKVGEVINKLDSLRIQYPSLVSVKWSIGFTYENRSMYTVRIAKNPDNPAGRPEIWLNGATHAREPLGVSNVLYFVYWLVENYNIDPIATYILNSREIYWTPIINVDGYYYNETTNPNGGGQQRKNRHSYGGSGTSIGVDLNRNFGTYNFWNSTNGGSDLSATGTQYRGPSPFSEPETQVFKTFVNSRNFKVQLDYHTYGNLLIKPWAWCDPTPTPDDAVFNEMGADIIADNHFTFGTPHQTVNYYVRGGDLDWIYSTDSTGHTYHIFAMTPEVGIVDFWPPQSNILPEAQTCFEMNKYICLVAGAYTGLKSATLNKTNYTQNETGNMKVVLRNKGLMNATNVKVTFTPLSSYVTIPVQVYNKASLPSRTSDSTTFNFTVSGTCPNNYGIPTRLKIMQNDTIVLYNQVYNILVGSGITTFADSAENGTTNWTIGTGWSITTAQYHSPTHSFLNTPSNSANTSMSLNFPLNLASYPACYLEYWNRYDAENGFDFCIVEVSSNNGTTWQQVTSYTGTNLTWTKQSFDISSKVNQSGNFRLRFRFTSDANTLGTGWWVDDIRITNFQGPATGIEPNINLTPNKFALEQNYPNPFNPTTQINYSIAKEGLVKITIFDVLGREVKTLVNEVKTPGFYAVDFDGTNLSSGMYFYRMESGSFVDTKKMTLIK